MTSHDFSLPIDSPQAFGHALKAAREHSGITLDAIANATKIPALLFAGLERGDLKHWPSGLFRRSYFRDYARMIGVPIAEACEAFTRLFPDQDPLPTPQVVKPDGPGQYVLDLIKNGVRIKLPY